MTHVQPAPIGNYGFPATADVALGDLCEIAVGLGATGVSVSDAYIRPISGATGPKVGVAQNASTNYPSGTPTEEKRVRVNLQADIITVSVSSSTVANRGQFIYATDKQTYTFSAPHVQAVPVGICLSVWDPGVAGGFVTVLRFSAEASHIFHAFAGLLS